MTNIVAPIVFLGLVAGGIVLLWWRAGSAADHTRRLRTSLFILYVLAVSFGAGLTQRDLFPFTAWPLLSARIPAVWNYPRLVGVDADGVEHAIDFRAWEPMSADELNAWMNHRFMTFPPDRQARIAAELLDRLEASRARAAAGEGVGYLADRLGPLWAPYFDVHPYLWSRPERVPAKPFVALRFYRQVWDLERRARDPSHVWLRLLYEFPAP